MRVDGEIGYIEFPGRDFAGAERFYGRLFGWVFGRPKDGQVVFRGVGAAGTFSADRDGAPTMPRVVFYARDLEVMRGRVRMAGGRIEGPIHAFAGGRRFYFTDPLGNQIGVWSEGVTESWTPTPETPRGRRSHRELESPADGGAEARVEPSARQGLLTRLWRWIVGPARRPLPSVARDERVEPIIARPVAPPVAPPVAAACAPAAPTAADPPPPPPTPPTPPPPPPRTPPPCPPGAAARAVWPEPQPEARARVLVAA